MFVLVAEGAAAGPDWRSMARTPSLSSPNSFFVPFSWRIAAVSCAKPPTNLQVARSCGFQPHYSLNFRTDFSLAPHVSLVPRLQRQEVSRKAAGMRGLRVCTNTYTTPGGEGAGSNYKVPGPRERQRAGISPSARPSSTLFRHSTEAFRHDRFGLREACRITLVVGLLFCD